MVTRSSPHLRERRRVNREASRAIKEGLCNRWSIRIRQSSTSLTPVAMVTFSMMMNCV